MHDSAAGKAASPEEVRYGRAGLISQKIWLPKLIYNALPWFYICSGLAAFLATLYINDWFWVLPHYVLFSLVCIHLGLLVYRRRRRHSGEQA